MMRGWFLAAAAGGPFLPSAKANHQGAFDAGIRGAAGGRVDEVGPGLEVSDQRGGIGGGGEGFDGFVRMRTYMVDCPGR